MPAPSEDVPLVIRKAVEICSEQIANDIEQRGHQALTDAEYDKLYTMVEDDGIRAAVEAFARGRQ